MANGVTTDTRNWDRAHSDIEVVKSRMTSLENSFIGFGEQLRDISKRLDTKPTDVWKIVGGVVGILALVGAFLYQGKAYIDLTLERQDREIGHLIETAVTKDVFQRSQDEQNSWLASLRDRARVDEEIVNNDRIALARLEGATTEQHEEYLREHADTATYIRTLDANLIKRPEIESGLAALRELYTLAFAGVGNRIDALIGSLNELRHDFGANFTLGDAVREIQLRLNALQLQPGLVAPAPAAQPK